jgi:hypothetical protein
MQGATHYRLIMRRGPQVDRAFPVLKDIVMLGRDAANDIVIADPEISRQHARLERRPDGTLTIEDLGSTNGTYVNGARLTGAHALNNGDLIGLGETITLLFQVAAAEATETVVGLSPARATPLPQPAVVAPPVAPPVAPLVAPRPAPAPASAPSPVRPTARAIKEPRGGGNLRATRSDTMRYIVLGCGCLVMLCVLCALVFVVGDQLFPDVWYGFLSHLPFYQPIIDVLRLLGMGG